MQSFEETEISYNSPYGPAISNFIKINLGGSRNETRRRVARRTDKQNELPQEYMQITVFLDVTPCSLVEIYRLLEKYTVSMIRIDSTLKMYAGGSPESRSILPDYTASHPVKPIYTYIPAFLILYVCLNPHFASVWTLLYLSTNVCSYSTDEPCPIRAFPDLLIIIPTSQALFQAICWHSVIK